MSSDDVADAFADELASAGVTVDMTKNLPDGLYVSYVSGNESTFDAGTVARVYVQFVEEIDGALIADVYRPDQTLPGPGEAGSDGDPAPEACYGIRPSWARDLKGGQLNARGLVVRMLSMDGEDVDELWDAALGERTSEQIQAEFVEGIEKNGFEVFGDGITRPDDEPFLLDVDIRPDPTSPGGTIGKSGHTPVETAFIATAEPFMVFATNTDADLRVSVHDVAGEYIDQFRLDNTLATNALLAMEDGGGDPEIERFLRDAIDSSATVDLDLLDALGSINSESDAGSPTPTHDV